MRWIQSVDGIQRRCTIFHAIALSNLQTKQVLKGIISHTTHKHRSN